MKPHVKATWVWNTWDIVHKPQDLISFASSKGVQELYLQVSNEVELPFYKAFNNMALKQGIRVYALDGSPSMALERERTQVKAFLSWVAEFQSKAQESEKFSGVHVDIEPYLLPEWLSDRDSVIRQWQSSMEFICRFAKQEQLHAGADMPFWFDEIPVPGQDSSLSSWMINQFDSITIMAYRDSAERILSASEQELQEAALLGKQVILAVETNPSRETPSVTFYEEGRLYMEEQLMAVQRLADEYASFGGFAVHDYHGWKSLK